MSVSRAMMFAVLIIAIVGGAGLMWAQTPDRIEGRLPECKLIKHGVWTFWDGSDPACRHLSEQGSRR
jgi:hypothetical protein